MFLPRLLIVLLLCGLSPSLAAETTIKDAWIRALPPTQPVTAAYATVVNNGEQAIQLTGAEIAGVGRVEIHTTREVDDLMRMERLSTLTIGPGQSVALQPGGSHFMLFDLEAMPRPGESRQLCLLFDSAEALCTEAAVRKSAEDDHGHHQHH